MFMDFSIIFPFWRNKAVGDWMRTFVYVSAIEFIGWILIWACYRGRCSPNTHQHSDVCTDDMRRCQCLYCASNLLSVNLRSDTPHIGAPSKWIAMDRQRNASNINQMKTQKCIANRMPSIRYRLFSGSLVAMTLTIRCDKISANIISLGFVWANVAIISSLQPFGSIICDKNAHSSRTQTRLPER